jgi:hypothetical protein
VVLCQTFLRRIQVYKSTADYAKYVLACCHAGHALWVPHLVVNA